MLKVFNNSESVAAAAAQYISEMASQAIQARDRFTIALSGGSTPWKMLRLLAEHEQAWDRWSVFQVDERVVPENDEFRNLLRIRENFAHLKTVGNLGLHAMEVESADLTKACESYRRILQEYCGQPPELDLVQLGLGSDGHTASLIPSDPVLEVNDTDVAICGPYQGHRRMTLTYPIINRARRVVWLVTGAEKAPALKKMLKRDPSIPAAHISQDRALVLADKAAAADI